LGYQRKFKASVHKREQSPQVRKLGVFIKSQIDDPTPPTSNVFYSHVLAGIEESCRLHHMLLMLTVVRVDTNSYPIEIPHLLLDNAVNAVLLVGICINDMFNAALEESNLPAVLVDANRINPIFDSVVIDNFEAGYKATKYLLDQGHHHIAFVGGFEKSPPSFVDRRRGHLQALHDERITEQYIIDCSYNDPQAVSETMCRIRQEMPEITAIMACNDKVAIELIQASSELAIAIPDDISIIGFDNITLADRIAPPLTTMNVDKVSLGRLGVEILLYRLRFPEAAVIQASLTATLLERKSVRRLV
jgi:LacI family transcriptional regulator